MRRNGWSIARLLALILLGFLSFGCSAVQNFNDKRYGRNNEIGEQWLSDQMFPAEIDVSGDYSSREWGASFLSQNGRDVRGHLGDYPVKGVVSGRKLHLLVSDSGWYYYSAVLEQPRPGVLVGYYSRSVPFRRDLRRELQLFIRP
ncbi:MAG: hypothetical protein Fur0032_12650 [Terrimicrobiaceae bacterium]